MADETWAAKVSPELKEEISELVKASGLSSKEFLEALISNHKIQLLQGNDSERHEDIQQVTYHLDKIKASFVGLVEKGIDLKEKFTEALEQESALHKGIVDHQQSQITLAHAERDKAILDKSAMESLMTDISARNSELEEINASQRITIQMQMEKLNQLESRIETVVELERKVSQLNQDNQMQAKKNESLEQESMSYKRELEIAQASREAQQRETTKAAEQLIQVHKLELDKAILEAEKKILEDNQKIRDEYVSKVEALTSRNQELTEKLHQMELASPQAKAKTKQPPVAKEKEKTEEEI